MTLLYINFRTNSPGVDFKFWTYLPEADLAQYRTKSLGIHLNFRIITL